MRTHLPLLSVILIAAFACTGGPTSDYPFDGVPVGRVDAGIASPGASDEEDAASDPTQGGTLDAAAPEGIEDAAACAHDAGSDPDAAGDAAGDAAADAGVDASADASDADASSDAQLGDAQLVEASADRLDDAGDAQIAEDANFPDSSDADAALLDASSDAAYTPDAEPPCVP